MLKPRGLLQRRQKIFCGKRGMPVAAPGGGGGGAPEPAAFLDFENGVYEAAGSPVSLGDLIAQDVTNWGAFDPETAIVPGQGLSGAGPVFAGEALARILAGATIRYDFHFGSTYNANMDWVDFPDWDIDWTFTASHVQYMKLYSGDAEVKANGTTPLGASANHVAVVTVTESKLSISADGGAFDTAATSAPSPAWNGSGVGIIGTGSYIRSITIYEPKADADLPALSALS